VPLLTSGGLGLGLKKLVLFTSLTIGLSIIARSAAFAEVCVLLNVILVVILSYVCALYIQSALAVRSVFWRFAHQKTGRQNVAGEDDSMSQQGRLWSDLICCRWATATALSVCLSVCLTIHSCQSSNVACNGAQWAIFADGSEGPAPPSSKKQLTVRMISENVLSPCSRLTITPARCCVQPWWFDIQKTLRSSRVEIWQYSPTSAAS